MDIKDKLYDIKEWLYWHMDLVVIVFFVVLIAYLALFFPENMCNSYGEATGRETKVVMMGCYVKHKDQWYSRGEYKHVRLDK